MPAGARPVERARGSLQILRHGPRRLGLPGTEFDQALPQLVFVIAGLAMLAMVPTLTGAWRNRPMAAKTMGGGAS